MKPILVAPSLLSADFSEAAKGLAAVEEAGCPWLHLDVMDGHFVPNLTFGPKMVADLRAKTKLFFDTHLMVNTPENFARAFIDAGSDAITFHAEACVHAHRLISDIRGAGKKAGIALVPSTSVSTIREVLRYIDIVLVMTVNPGFGGQQFIRDCLHKIRELSDLRAEHGYDFLISVDGGINETSAPFVTQNGADVLVMGSAFFNAADRRDVISAVTMRSGRSA